MDSELRAYVWSVSIAIDVVGTLFVASAGWRVTPSHFAERFALIVIIALGESIVAIGIGAAGIELDATVVTAAVLGLILACALWWAYFDIVALLIRKRLMEAHGHDRARLARDTFSYLHLPMFAGIVLVALGAKKVLEHVNDPLATVPAVALCGGVAVYLLSHDAMRYRSVRTVNRRRLVAAAASAALIPVATRVDGVVSLALVAGVCVALIAYETLRFRAARARLRTAP